MTVSVEPRRLTDLIRLFDGLRELHERLLDVIRSKIDAMKRADIAAMQEHVVEEQDLARRLQQREGLRRQLMDAIGKELGLKSLSARDLTVSQLESHLPESARRRLREQTNRLTEVVAKVARINRVAGALSREVLNHVKWVFASVKPKADKSAGYSGNGELLSEASSLVFETVG